MSGVLDRRPIDEAVKVMLEEVTSRPIGKGNAPQKNNDDQAVADTPYAILYPITGGEWWGPPWGAQEDAANFHYQVTSVGLTDDQAQWMGDAVRQAMVGRDESYVLEQDLSVPGMYVVGREAVGPPGGVTAGGKIFSVIDIYTVKVSLR